MDCYSAVREVGYANDLHFATCDLIPPQEADVVIFMTQPTPRDAKIFKHQHPAATTILVLLETALGARYTFNRRNHSGFDAVFTYDTRLIDGNKYFDLPPHAYLLGRVRTGQPFAARRAACLVGANREIRFRSGLNAMRKGWHFSLLDWFDYMFCPGELMTYRADVAKAFASVADAGFDLFGEGWEVFPETRGVSKGVPARSSLDYLGDYRYCMAFENHESSHSLISERVWDALWGDCVPVYRGNANIRNFVPAECYVDARLFARQSHLIEFIRSASANDWELKREARRDFLSSDAVRTVLPSSFATHFVTSIAKVIQHRP